MRSQMSNPPRPPFCASWPGSPWFLQSSSQVDGDHLKPMIIQASDWYLGGARAGHCKDTPWVSPKICGVPNSTALPCFFAIIGIAIWGVHPTFRHIPFTQQNAAYSVVETVCAKVWAGSMLRGVQREKRCAVKSTFIVTKGEYLWFLK